jgi:hypothetical protein
MEWSEVTKRNDSKGRLLSKKKMKEKVEEFIRTPRKFTCGETSK